VIRRVTRRARPAPPELDLTRAAVDAWRTNDRVTRLLVEGIPADLWAASPPARRGRSIRAIAAHLHNSRRTWIATLGKEHGIAVPERVDERTVTRRALVAALRKSGAAMGRLFALGAAHGGRIPDSAGYTWRNLPLDLGHVLSYFAAHEGHHRGQIVMLARQMGRRLPREVIDSLWQFTRLSRKRTK
jgi:uncharacterized damage-inducible protein DinB